jgi:hypothetical protein
MNYEPKKIESKWLRKARFARHGVNKKNAIQSKEN